MPTAVRQFASGAPVYANFLDWEKAYAERARNLGSTLTIVPLGDPRRGAINSSTFTTRAQVSGSAQTATWASAGSPSAMATPFKLEPELGAAWATGRLYGPSGIPLLIPDGSIDYLTIPDATYWSAVAPAVMSIIWTGVMITQSGSPILMAKYTTTNPEWYLHTGARKPDFTIYDHTNADAACEMQAHTALSVNIPYHIAVTYDGAANATGVVIYVNGAVVSSDVTNNGGFVSMRNTASVASVMADGSGNSKNLNPVFGGPFGPAVTQTTLTATQVLNDYRLFVAHLGLN